jgi:hypothetical protein
METIKLKNGHEILKQRFNEMLQYFKQNIEKYNNYKVIKAENPKTETDYSYLVSGNYEEIPKELITIFGKAGLKTKILNLAKNCFIIKLNT